MPNLATSFRKYGRWQPKRRSASEENRLRETVTALAAHPGNHIAGVPMTPATYDGEKLLIQITGAAVSIGYPDFTEVIPDGAGGHVAPADPVTGSAGLIAYEENLDLTVPIGSIVEATWTDTDPPALTFEAPAGPLASGATIEDPTHTPSFPGIHTLQFDQADGFSLSNPSPGVARLDLLPASATQTGVVDTSAQQFAGHKTFIGSYGTGGVTFAGIVAGGVDNESSINFEAASICKVGYFNTASGTNDSFFVDMGPGDPRLYYGYNGSDTRLELFNGSGSAGQYPAVLLYDSALTMRTGQSGLDALGNRFTGGWCTTLFATIQADLSISGFKLTNVANPTAAQDAATKAYVDSLSTGLSWKAAVRVATTTNGTLASAYANGQTVDGVVLATGDRILLKNQTTASENGLYVVAASGAPARAPDADTGAELVSATVMVREGTANADTQWTCTTDAISLGSTSIAFAQISGAGTYTNGTGLALTGNVFSLANTAVTPGSYTNVNATVDQQGRITAMSNGSAGVANTLTDYPGTTTNAFVTVFNLTNANGLHGSFSLKNTHASFGLSAKVTVTDAFGDTANSTVVVAASAKAGCFFEAANTTWSFSIPPPYTGVKLEVTDQVSGSHAGFDCKVSLVG